MSDARFEDARGAPLRLRAFDVEDLQVISALVQDGVVPLTEMTWQKSQRRFGLLVNRLRHEDDPAARGEVERVQSVLAIEDVIAVSSQGLDREDRDLVVQIMAVTLEPGADGGGRVVLTLAGDGAIAIEVEALEVTLRDVTRPYLAPSGKVPDHGA